MTTNCIKFTSADIETAKGVGSISTLTFDLDITVEPVASSNPMAPTHRVLGRSPRGKLVECGGIWKKQNKETGADYYTLTIRDHGFNAPLMIHVPVTKRCNRTLRPQVATAHTPTIAHQ